MAKAAIHKPDDDEASASAAEPLGVRAAQRAEKREQVRQRLLEAARQVFEEMGYHPTRVSDITSRAQVSHGLFYNYFDSKQDVFREVAAEVDRNLVDSADAYLEARATVTPQERMRLAIRANFERFQRQARILDVIGEAAHVDPQVAAARLALNRAEAARLADEIRTMQGDGIADPALDPEITAVALGAMGWRFAERWFIHGELDCDLDTGAEQFLRLVLNSLGIAWTDAV
jgi:AcrR family transcriptional regulator